MSQKRKKHQVLPGGSPSSTSALSLPFRRIGPTSMTRFPPWEAQWRRKSFNKRRFIHIKIWWTKISTLRSKCSRQGKTTVRLSNFSTTLNVKPWTTLYANLCLERRGMLQDREFSRKKGRFFPYRCRWKATRSRTSDAVEKCSFQIDLQTPILWKESSRTYQRWSSAPLTIMSIRGQEKNIR